jgi:CHAT domain-containing protein
MLYQNKLADSFFYNHTILIPLFLFSTMIIISGCMAAIVGKAKRAEIAGNYETAISLYQEEIDLIEKQVTENGQRGRGPLLAEYQALIHVLQKAGRYEESLAVIKKWADHYKASDDELISLYRKKMGQRREKWIKNEEKKQEIGRSATIHTEFAIAFCGLNDFEKARPHVEKVLETYEYMASNTSSSLWLLPYKGDISKVFEAYSTSNDFTMLKKLADIVEGDIAVTDDSDQIIKINDSLSNIRSISALAIYNYRIKDYHKAEIYQKINIRKFKNVDRLAAPLALAMGYWAPVKSDYYLQDELLLVKIYLAQDNVKEAEDIVLDLQKNLSKDWPEFLSSNLTWELDYLNGQIHELKKNNTEAERYYRMAIDKVERFRIRMDNSRNRILFDSSRNSLYASMIQTLVDQNKISEAFDYAERSRARAFLDMIGDATIQAKIPDDNKILVKRSEVIRNANEFSEKTMANSQTSGQEKLRAINILENDLQAVESQIGEQYPEFGSVVCVKVQPLERIQQSLDAKQEILAYYTADDNLSIWVVSTDDIKYKSIPCTREKIEKLVQSYRQELFSSNQIQTSNTASELYEILIKPIENYIRSSSHLCIVPHGILHQLPYQTLTDGKEYLISKKSISYAPSGNILSICRKKPRPGESNILAFGNPDLGDQKYALPFAKNEVLEIKNVNDQTVVFLEEKASKMAFEANAGNYSIIHMATHGIYDPINPMRSGLMLAGTEPGISMLTTEEIFNLQLNAKLVTLSACESALGKVTRGDEIIGISRAFLYAGTPSVISTLWQVDDRATAELMIRFYTHMKNQNKARALQAAQLELMKKYPNPYFWGAFILTGDWS